MATDTKQSTAPPPTSNEGDRSHQEKGLIQKSQENKMAKGQRSGLFGFPLTPQEMLRMHPLSFLGRITEEFDRILQPVLPESDTGNVAWIPTIEVSQHDGKYQILVELPGLSPNEVRVEVDNDAVILQGERQFTREANDGGIRRSERQFGMFYRRIPLPEGADPEQATAKFHDGILEITMPAPKKQAERRQIQVEADSRSSPDASQHAA